MLVNSVAQPLQARCAFWGGRLSVSVRQTVPWNGCAPAPAQCEPEQGRKQGRAASKAPPERHETLRGMAWPAGKLNSHSMPAVLPLLVLCLPPQPPPQVRTVCVVRHHPAAASSSAGFDPFYLGVPLGGGGAAVLDPWDPFSALGAYGPVGGGAGAFLGPYYTPGASGATRRRLGAPVGGVEAGGGGGEAGGEAGAGAGAGGRRTREPYTVGSAGWTRSIPCDFIERDNEYVVRAGGAAACNCCLLHLLLLLRAAARCRPCASSPAAAALLLPAWMPTCSMPPHPICADIPGVKKVG